jgi:hypothetical protein
MGVVTASQLPIWRVAASAGDARIIGDPLRKGSDTVILREGSDPPLRIITDTAEKADFCDFEPYRIAPYLRSVSARYGSFLIRRDTAA